MKLYISGPVTGYEEGNKPAFDLAKRTLTEMGHEVASPFDGETAEETKETLQDKYGKRYWKVLAKDILMMTECEGLVFLKGWEQSRGARIEAFIALLSNLPMQEFSYDVKADQVHLRPLSPAFVAGVCAAEWMPQDVRDLVA